MHNYIYIFFLSGLFCHDYSRITGLQGKRESISITPHYHVYPLYRYLDAGWEITAEISPLHIASSGARTGNLWFPNWEPLVLLTTKLADLEKVFIHRMQAQSKFYSSNCFILETNYFSLLNKS